MAPKIMQDPILPSKISILIIAVGGEIVNISENVFCKFLKNSEKMLAQIHHLWYARSRKTNEIPKKLLQFAGVRQFAQNLTVLLVQR